MIVATTNDENGIPVWPGERGRRWLPVKVGRKAGNNVYSVVHIREITARERPQLWAEVVAATGAGKHSCTPAVLEEIFRGLVAEHRTRNEAFEDALQGWVDRRVGAFTTAEVRDALRAEGYREGDTKIAATFRAMGFSKVEEWQTIEGKRTRKRLWHPPLQPGATGSELEDPWKKENVLIPL